MPVYTPNHTCCQPIVGMPAQLGTLMVCRTVMLLSNHICSSIQALCQVPQLPAGKYLNCSLSVRCILQRQLMNVLHVGVAACLSLQICAALCSTVQWQQAALSRRKCCVTPLVCDCSYRCSHASEGPHIASWCNRRSLSMSSHKGQTLLLASHRSIAKFCQEVLAV